MPVYFFVDLTKVYKVIVEAGQVLYVPHHWWHYVENLEVAITVNTWIPSVSVHPTTLLLYI